MDQVGDGRGHGLRFRVLVRVLGEYRIRPRCAHALEREPGAAESSRASRDHGVGQVHHLRGGAVVGLQAHDRGLGVSVGEAEEEVRFGARERVDGLVDVPDHREVVTVAQPCGQEPLLGRGDVLELVDDETAVPVTELLRDGRDLLHEVCHVSQQIIEVEHPDRAGDLEVLVGPERPGDLMARHREVPAERDGLLGVVIRREQARLGPTDLGQDVSDGFRGRVQPDPADGLGDGPELTVQELPWFLAVDPRPEVGEVAQRGGVEGPCLDRARTGIGDTESRQSHPELPGRACGERHGQDLITADVAGVHEMRDAPGDGAGFSRARTRQDADGATRGQHGPALLGIQSLERGFPAAAVPTFLSTPSHVSHAPIVASGSDIPPRASPGDDYGPGMRCISS